MIKEVKEGNTLLIKGPTRVVLREGQIEVFGKILTPQKDEESNTLIVPSATVYPIYSIKDTKVDVVVG